MYSHGDLIHWAATRCILNLVQLQPLNVLPSWGSQLPPFHRRLNNFPPWVKQDWERVVVCLGIERVVAISSTIICPSTIQYVKHMHTDQQLFPVFQLKSSRGQSTTLILCILLWCGIKNVLKPKKLFWTLIWTNNLQTYLRTYTHTYIHTYMLTYLLILTYYLLTYFLTYVLTYTHTFTHTHTHTHTNWWLINSVWVMQDIVSHTRWWSQ